MFKAIAHRLRILTQPKEDLTKIFDSTSDKSIYERVQPFTMTSPQRVSALIKATRYVAKNKIQGDIVECGVWRGGSSMSVALTLIEEDNIDRSLFLFDTFSGMPSPTDLDVSFDGDEAAKTFEKTKTSGDSSDWCAATVDEVRFNMKSTGYAMERVFLIEGKVEHTLPESAPDKIAVLRLDTDWYESTKHELEHLFPRLVRGGVLIIDDYGHWDGARKAVDEYLSELPILLNRIDYTGRIAIKS